MNNMNKILCLILGIFITFQVQASNNWKMVPAPPLLGSKAYVLMDAQTGDVILQHNAHSKLPPASLTKLMTAYIVVQQLHNKELQPDDLVTISVKAWKTGGSRMYAKVHDNIPVLELLKGIIIQSGNDASVAVAEHIAGSEESFVHLMNQKAKQLGMLNTNFMNSNGLTNDEHYSSAYDIALLSRAIIIEDSDYYHLYSQLKYKWNNIEQPNRNELLIQDKSVDGLKTGHTDAAGYCLSASAKRNDRRLIAVILGANRNNIRNEETMKLLNYGFNFYNNYTVVKTNQVIGNYQVFKGIANNLDVGVKQDVTLTLLKNQDKALTQEVVLQNHLIAPIKAGDKVGELIIKSENNELKRVALIALNTIESGGLFKRTLDSIKLGWKS